MHEFTGRLEKWFKNNNIELYYYNCNQNIITTKGTIQVSFNLHKKESKYKAILKIFELLKDR